MDCTSGTRTFQSQQQQAVQAQKRLMNLFSAMIQCGSGRGSVICSTATESVSHCKTLFSLQRVVAIPKSCLSAGEILKIRIREMQRRMSDRPSMTVLYPKEADFKFGYTSPDPSSLRLKLFFGHTLSVTCCGGFGIHSTDIIE